MTDIETLAALEAQHGFRYPDIYRAICKQGMLRGDATPRFLDCADDFRALRVEDIVPALQRLRDPESVFRCAPEHRVIPFGRTGAGDCYGFDLNAPTDLHELPVALLWHDNGGFADRVAGTLHDFIFERLLDAVVNPWEWDDELAQRLDRMLATHEGFLQPAHREIVREVYARPAFDYTIPWPNKRGFDNARGRLTRDDCDALVAMHAPYALAGQRFAFALPEPVVEVNDSNRRCVGTLTLTLNGYSAIRARIAPALKALNWRMTASPDDDRCTLTRKNHVFFGPPSMAQLDDPFGQRLNALLQQAGKVEIRFQAADGRAWVL